MHAPVEIDWPRSVSTIIWECNSWLFIYSLHEYPAYNLQCTIVFNGFWSQHRIRLMQINRLTKRDEEKCPLVSWNWPTLKVDEHDIWLWITVGQTNFFPRGRMSTCTHINRREKAFRLKNHKHVLDFTGAVSDEIIYYTLNTFVDGFFFRILLWMRSFLSLQQYTDTHSPSTLENQQILCCFFPLLPPFILNLDSTESAYTELQRIGFYLCGFICAPFFHSLSISISMSSAHVNANLWSNTDGLSYIEHHMKMSIVIFHTEKSEKILLECGLPNIHWYSVYILWHSLFICVDIYLWISFETHLL